MSSQFLTNCFFYIKVKASDVSIFLNFTLCFAPLHRVGRFFFAIFNFIRPLMREYLKTYFLSKRTFPISCYYPFRDLLLTLTSLKKNTEEEAIKYIRAHFCMMGQLQKVREWKHKSPCINIKEICSQSLANKVGIFHILKYSKDDIKWDPSAKNQRPQVHAASRKLVQV